MCIVICWSSLTICMTNFLSFSCPLNFVANSLFEHFRVNYSIFQANFHNFLQHADEMKFTLVHSLAVKCPPIAAPKNGHMTGDTCHGSYQAKCFFKCNHGYLRYGPPYRECLSNKQWSGQEVRCDGKISNTNSLSNPFKISINSNLSLQPGLHKSKTGSDVAKQVQKIKRYILYLQKE